MESGYIYLNSSVFPTIIAISEEEQAKGLMKRDWPPPIMSFIYTSPRVTQFWMKNTPSPLDIVFSCNGIITQICRGEPWSTKLIGDYLPSDLVVELPYGTTIASGIKIGHKVGLVKPTLDELKIIIDEKYRGIVKI